MSVFSAITSIFLYLRKISSRRDVVSALVREGFSMDVAQVSLCCNLNVFILLVQYAIHIVYISGFYCHL